MNTDKLKSESFDENQSLQVIREMIQVSHKKLKNDGILFILWGWISFIRYLSEYLLGILTHTHQIKLFIKYTGVVLTILGFIYTIIYV